MVDEVSFRVDPGEVVGLLGPNGAGKTTSFRMTAGMVRPEGGRVVLDGREITRWPVHRRARIGLGYLAQDPSVFRSMTVRDNLLAVLETRPLRSRERKARCGDLLEDFDLADLAGQKAETLSGGERRRVEIARTLAMEPKVMLLDEPFSGVDPIAVQGLQDILMRLRDRGIGILLTDHAVRETLHITDRSYILVDGRILKDGRPKDLVEDPDVRRAYLGDRFELGAGVSTAEEAGLAGDAPVS